MPLLEGLEMQTCSKKLQCELRRFEDLLNTWADLVRGNRGPCSCSCVLDLPVIIVLGYISCSAILLLFLSTVEG